MLSRCRSMRSIATPLFPRSHFWIRKEEEATRALGFSLDAAPVSVIVPVFVSTGDTLY